MLVAVVPPGLIRPSGAAGDLHRAVPRTGGGGRGGGGLHHVTHWAAGCRNSNEQQPAGGRRNGETRTRISSIAFRHKFVGDYSDGGGRAGQRNQPGDPGERAVVLRRHV
jgi:hypothetical protein